METFSPLVMLPPNQTFEVRDIWTTPNPAEICDLSSGSSSQRSQQTMNDLDLDGAYPSKPLTGQVLDVACGNVTAKMYTNMFFCPGIHMPCIELDGEMLTPKQFTFRARKDRQKDWKGSIRVNKKSLRSLFALNLIDFYDHSRRCSSKCQSRNHMSNRIGKEGVKRSAGGGGVGDVSKKKRAAPRQPIDCNRVRMNEQEQQQQLMFPPANYYPPAIPLPPAPLNPAPFPGMQNNILPGLSYPGTLDARSAPGPDQMMQPHQQQPIPTPDEHLLNMLHMDPVSFWSEMQRVGQIDNVFDEIDQVVNSIKNSSIPNGEMTLTRLISAANLEDDIFTAILEQQMTSLSYQRAGEMWKQHQMQQQQQQQEQQAAMLNQALTAAGNEEMVRDMEQHLMKNGFGPIESLMNQQQQQEVNNQQVNNQQHQQQQDAWQGAVVEQQPCSSSNLRESQLKQLIETHHQQRSSHPEDPHFATLTNVEATIGINQGCPSTSHLSPTPTTLPAAKSSSFTITSL